MEDAAAPEPKPHRHAPRALWRIAAGFLNTLYTLFGAPEDVAARHTLRRDAHKFLTSWLRVGEAVLRRLLLIEAAAYSKPNVRPLLKAKRTRVRKPYAFFPESPETWRVSFRCFHASPVHGGGGRAATGRIDCLLNYRAARADCSPETWGARPMSFRSAWPLAERYEALIRVFNDPTYAARRLARRLHATPHRVGEVLIYPEDRIEKIERKRFAKLDRRARRSWALKGDTHPQRDRRQARPPPSDGCVSPATRPPPSGAANTSRA